MVGNKPYNRIIPEGENECIWVDAGLVSFKLCDLGYDCERCAFDLAMKQQHRRPPAGAEIHGEGTSFEPAVSPSTETLADVLEGFFTPSTPVSFPIDRSYTANHVWMKSSGEGTVRVGIDHGAALFLDGIGDIILPDTDSSVSQNDPLAWALCENGTVAVRSPIAGRVRTSNQLLRNWPSLVRRDPYERGWLCEVVPDRKAPESHGALTAAEMAALSDAQLRDLKKEVLDDLGGGSAILGTTLLDGGIRPRSLNELLGPKKYVAFLQRLLSSRV